MPLIVEGIFTTLNADGSVNIAPLGPVVDAGLTRFLLRPYETSQTFANLKRSGEGVFHITDDVELIAKTAIGQLEPRPALQPAAGVEGSYLVDACRWYALRVTDFDDSEPRAEVSTEVVSQGQNRAFFGFNRAKHAVVEAAILATRIGLIPAAEIRDQIQRLAVLVEKTGGAPERRAFAYLNAHIEQAQP